jgi:hypothetical protein
MRLWATSFGQLRQAASTRGASALDNRARVSTSDPVEACSHRANGLSRIEI